MLFAPLDSRANFLHNDLLCNGVVCNWRVHNLVGAQTEKIPQFSVNSSVHRKDYYLKCRLSLCHYGNAKQVVIRMDT